MISPVLLNIGNVHRLVLFTVACSALPAAGPIDFPVALNTRWTYHQHTELGQGVHFNEEDEKLAKGNVLDKVVISTATGLDMIGAVKYTRVETRQMDGKSVLTEWYASTPSGLLLGKTREADGSEITMSPPQRLLILPVAPDAAWTWKDTISPVSMVANIVGTVSIRVPAGTYQAIETSHVTTIRTQATPIVVKQSRWYAPGVGYVKQDFETHIGTHLINHVVTTLDKFELGH